MLKLKRVELQGFKSFCDRTEMRFNGAGLAAVVGPNGCGKSNLSDAISWVLGEQSAKSLRGSRMQDVIFAGTHNRKPVGMAAVTMTLVDPEYHIAEVPLEQVHLGVANGNGSGENGANGHGTNGFNGHTQPAAEAKQPPKERKPREITITRRLFRSGESEYLVNGKLARLRDIQDLFMGTGLGPESYAIIEQGRIGQILSSRPHDRRAVIEEAAGISKFKSRRRLAEAKLEGARQNLSRVFDILEEVGRQVNSLNRQAKKAERFRTLHGEMIVELRRSLVGRYRTLEREAAKTALDLNQAAAALHEARQEVSGKETLQTETQEKAYATESELTETRGRLSELKVAAERTRGRLESQARQIADIEVRLTQGETETQSIEQRTAELAQQVEAHRRQTDTLDEATGQARASLAAKSQERDRAQQEYQRQEQTIEQTRQSVLRLIGEAGQLKNQLAQIDGYLASIERDTGRSLQELAASTEELQRLEGLRTELSGELRAQRSELETVSARKSTVEKELSSKRQAIGEARRNLDELRSVTSRLKARKESLDEILSHRAYTTEAVKSFFTAVEHGQTENLKPIGVLADFVDVDPAYEKAAEEFLHDELEYIVVRNWDEAEKGVELMRRDLDGRATFVIHPEPDAAFAAPPQEPPLGPETGIRQRLSGVLHMTNGLTHAPAELVPRIARCLIAEDHAVAQRLAQRYPDFYFLLDDGVCYHGFAVSGGRKTSSGPLALKRELRELKVLVRSRQEEMQMAAALVETTENEIRTLSEELDQLRGQQQEQEKEALALEHQLRNLNDEHRRAEKRKSISEAELERLTREKERALERRAHNEAAAEQKEQDRRKLDEEQEAARAKVDDLKVAVSGLAEEHSALRVQVAECEERQRSERSALQRLESQHRELTSRRSRISAEMERLGVERARLLTDNIELDKYSSELAEELAASEETAARLSAEESRLREALATTEEALKQLRAGVQQLQENRSGIEVSLAEKRAELKFLEETAQKELETSLKELAEAEEEILDGAALAEAEEKYNLLKKRIESLGPVNPQALEEYEEAKQRYDFLNAQRQDLLDSIRDTEKAIHEIDVETRKRFAQAFEAVNENFRHTFRTLFGGGTGEMRLTDASNLADSGIDIVASPPGKRLQSVLLLSGGEKALTALALLMAIFQYQPSPFCVLDEVDAPLDEANIQRMLRLLKGMSEQTQFVVITHAKSTMEASQALYGVTMQEPGVSKLVSVKFHPLLNGQTPPAQAQAVTV